MGRRFPTILKPIIMKTKEEIIDKYVSKHALHTNVVTKEDALIAMNEYTESFVEDFRNAYDSRAKAMSDIASERIRQNRKWGVQYHNLPEWIAILTEEVGEASKEAVDYHFSNLNQSDKEILDRFRKELVQVAAVAVQVIEHIDEGEKFKNK